MASLYLDVIDFTKSGGAAIYVWNNIKAAKLVSVSAPKLYELLMLNVELSQNALFTVAGIYCLSSALLKAATDIFENLTHFMTSEVAVMGDLNLNWMSTDSW